MNYAQGTYIEHRYPWGVIVGAKALCPDNVVRKVQRISQTADTFFSVPASVRFKGKTVAGYVTVECESGSSVVTPEDPAVVKFKPYRYCKNGTIFGEAQ